MLSLRDFPLGPTPLLLIFLSLASGLTIATVARPSPRPDLEMWVFAGTHFDEYQSRLRAWPRDAPTVRVQNLGGALRERLALAALTGDQLPDLVEIESNDVGIFLRGPADALPLTDITDPLRDDGLLDRLVRARLVRYSRDGRFYGIPHDLHPVVLAYRYDLLAEQGIDPDSIRTWDDLAALAPRLSRGGRIGTPDWRYTIGLSNANGDEFVIMLWQRGGGAFDEHGNVILDNDLAVDTLERYAAMFRGNPPLACPRLVRSNDDAQNAQALSDGHYVMLVVADWGLGFYKSYQADILRGKLRIMPLPAWSPGQRRTSTQGGTMLGFPRGTGLWPVDRPEITGGTPVPRDGFPASRGSQRFDDAWRLAKFLYFDETSLLNRYDQTMIVPPVLDVLKNPHFDRPEPFYADQPVGRLLADLAPDVPPIYGAAYSSLIGPALGNVFPEVIAGRMSAREALTRAANELRGYLARDTH